MKTRRAAPLLLLGLACALYVGCGGGNIGIPTEPLAITTTSLPDGVIGQAYNETLEASGGSPPFTWSIISGTLPAGLSLDASTGVISGTPAGPADIATPAPFTLQVTDSGFPTQTATRELSIRIAEPLVITTLALPDGVAGRGYSFVLAAIGGIPPFTWSEPTTFFDDVTGAGAVSTACEGLSLGFATGTIAGTPALAGTCGPFTLQVTDSASPAQTTTRDLTLVVQAALTIVNATLQNGLKGSAYQQTLAATGGLPGYTWTVVDPAVDPPGLDFTLTGPDTGTYEGVPTTAGAFTFTIRVTDTGNFAVAPAATDKVFTVVITDTLAYVTNAGANAVSVIDTSTNTVVTTVGVGSFPIGVAITPDGTRAYVVNEFSNNVSVIATATNTVVAAVGVGGVAPRGVAITPDGSRAYVSNSLSNNVSVIATASNTVVATVGVGSFPRGVAITPDGAFAYVANAGSNNVSVIATATNTVVATVAVGSAPVGVAITPDGTRAYVTNGGSNNVSVIDTSGNTVVTTVGVGSAPFGVALTPDGSRAYVNNIFADNVSVIDTSTNSVVATVGVGVNPAGVAITPDGTRAYVANRGSNNVSVIDTSTNTVVATVGVGSFPCCEQGVATMPNPSLQIPTSTLPDGIVGVAYSFSVVAAGGVPPFTFSADPTSLPPGLSLAANGLISGTPTTVGMFSFDVTVTDAAVPAESVTKTVTLEVRAPLAYVTNNGTTTVSVIDTSTNSVVATVGVGTNPRGVALTPDGTRAYVSNQGFPPIVSVIDTATNSVVATVGVVTEPGGVAITPDGSRAYVTGISANAVAVIDTATNTVVATFAVGGAPAAVALTPDGTRAYVTNRNSNTVSVIATASNSVVATVGVGLFPRGVAITPDGTRAYVAHSGSTTVSVIDTDPGSGTFHTVVATVGVGISPIGVAITPDGTRAYVANGGATTVSVIDTSTNSVVATVGVGSFPQGVAITPDGARAYVANFFSNTVSVIDTDPGSATFHTVVATITVGALPCCEQGVAIQFGR